MAAAISSLDQFKEVVINNLSKNVDVRNYDAKSHLKVQLIESNLSEIPSIQFFEPWKKLEDTGYWFVTSNSKGETVILNKYTERIWALYSLMKVDTFSKVINGWVDRTLGLDRCWLPLGFLQYVGKEMNWIERGIGIRFRDALSEEVFPSQVSLKAWYGSNGLISKLVGGLKDNFSVNSLRYKEQDTSTVSEWYSNGKITFNSSNDFEMVLDSVNSILDKYSSELEYATKLRESERGSFELVFKQNVNKDLYSETVKTGKTDLKLWMTEIESYSDFKRFRGVDLHTWDRVFLDLGDNYAYLTVPGRGCVNAAPRIVTLQGESVMGKTKVFYNGDEIFV